MTHAPIDGRYWCREKGEHRWDTGHKHRAPCCLHAGHSDRSTPSATGEPTTEAGRRILREWLMLKPDYPPNTARVRDWIIEAEAEARERENARWLEQSAIAERSRREARAGRAEPLDARFVAARFVAEHWRDAYLDYLRQGKNEYGIGTHALALVLAAMEGETDPVQLGLSDDVHDAFLARLRASTSTDEGTGG